MTAVIAGCGPVAPGNGPNPPGGDAAALMCSTCCGDSATCRSVRPANTPNAGHPTLDVTSRTATDPGPDALAIADPNAFNDNDRCATDNACIDDCDAIRAYPELDRRAWAW